MITRTGQREQRALSSFQLVAHGHARGPFGLGGEGPVLAPGQKSEQQPDTHRSGDSNPREGRAGQGPHSKDEPGGFGNQEEAHMA